MRVSETTQKIYDGISNILKENGQPLTKAQKYALENLVQAVEDSTEKRCYEMTKSIIAKKDAITKQKIAESGNSSEESIVEKVNQIVESRVEQLKKEIPASIDYAKMKRLESCLESIKECVGYNSDEQVRKVALESANMLKTTKSLIETQKNTISEKVAVLAECTSLEKKMTDQLKQMKTTIAEKEKQITESTKKNMELVNQNQNLQKKIEEGKRIIESIEQKRQAESLKFYLEEKIQKYPKYEADLLRKHFSGAKSKAEIDENFKKALAMVSERRDAMRKVSAIPVAKADDNNSKQQQQNSATKKILGETTVSRQQQKQDDGEISMNDYFQESDDFDSFISISDEISPQEMQDIISRC